LCNAGTQSSPAVSGAKLQQARHFYAFFALKLHLALLGGVSIFCKLFCTYKTMCNRQKNKNMWDETYACGKEWVDSKCVRLTWDAWDLAELWLSFTVLFLVKLFTLSWVSIEMGDHWGYTVFMSDWPSQSDQLNLAGHLSMGRQNEYWWWLRLLLGKKQCKHRPCWQDGWHSDSVS